MDINIFIIILLIVLTEGLTELIVKSKFFRPLKSYLFNRKSKKFFKFLHDLLDCGYCTSVWVAYFVVGLYYFLGVEYLFLLTPVVIHRLSNLYHFVNDRIDEKY